MALFQKSVLNKYLKSLDDKKVKAAFQKFTAFFQNPEIIKNIREDKEEQFQYGFLQKLFDEALDYTINPNPDYNLTTEFKNLRGAKKADGAILKDGKAIGVIELKSTKTKELAKITDQAFGYKNNHPTCVYIITSNFEKLRFYINDAVDYLDFDLFTMREDEFKLLYLCLQKDQILKDIPLKIKKDSALQEENVTKKLYKDYSAFKTALYQDLVKNNPTIPKLTLFKKSQKLIDRFLFILFAEDKGLLPPNSVTAIVKRFDALEDLDNYKPLYKVFQQYFGYINTGRPARKGKVEIFAFNGGLFAPDAELDNLKISDAILMNHTLLLSAYDFESEVDVNILGHIFEHSLNEIDTIQLELLPNGASTIGKRKKDGVFYTPKYITKYIVDNTVGKLCEAKKAELKFDENEYRPNRNKATKKRLLMELETYRSYLLGLTICDPACGSGAFLNQALDFLIREHHYLDGLQTRLLGGSIILSDITNDILERNIYGVDINEESVEIARLSLWLRTAKKGRALTSLNKNIKCGNSVVDDEAFAGKKAFHWQSAFPDVFEPVEKQAFHVVLTTHNSRMSQRMIEFNVEKGESINLSLPEEIRLTKIIGNIIKEQQYACLEYNVCMDHIHLLLVCEPENLVDIVRRIKSDSARKFNIWKGITIPQSSTDLPVGLAPLHSKKRGNDNGASPTGRKKRGETQNHLWSQKFFRANLDVWQLATLSNKPGYLYKDTYLDNAIPYIRNNRKKHNLPESAELNALIESFTVSQAEAFTLEYKGGFDVIIGNPPYVRQELISPFKPYLTQHYQTYAGTADLFTYFIEKGVKDLLHPNGLYSIIVANKWMRANYGKPLREWIKTKRIVEIIDFADLPVFADATAYPCILTLSPQPATTTFYATEPTDLAFADLEIYVQQNRFAVATAALAETGWALVDQRVSDLLEKLKTKGVPLKEYVDNKIYYGIKTGLNEAFVIDKTTRDRLIAEDTTSAEIIKPFLAGRDVKRYAIHFQDSYLILIPSGWTNANRGEQEAWEYFSNKYQSVATYLKQHEIKAKKRYDKGDYWWELRACAYYDEFENNKIVLPDISITCNSAYDYTGTFYLVNTAYIIVTEDKSLNCKLNSKLLNFYYGGISPSIRGGYLRFIYQYLAVLPIVNREDIDTNLSLLNQEIHEVNKKIIAKVSRFLRRLASNLHLPKTSKKIESFYEYDFKTLVAELKKKKIKLSLSDQDEWEEYFTTYKNEILELQQQIDQTDREIDQMVYELYGLTEAEIAIVEQA